MTFKIDEVKNTESKGSSNYSPVEEGTHVARIVQLVTLGMQERPPFKGEEKAPCNQILVTFELPNERIEIDGEDRPRWISVIWNFFTDEKSKIMQMVKALDPNGKITKGDISNLLGYPCMVTVWHRSKGDRVYANVGSVGGVPKGMPVGDLENDTVLFDFDNPDMDEYDKLAEWVKNKIGEAVNFDGSALQRLIEQGEAPLEGVDNDIPFDDDLPFDDD